jgi:arylsulfatase
VGLFSRPLLASMIVTVAAGDVVGRFAKHRIESGPGEKMGALPPGSVGIIAVRDREKADPVDAPFINAVKTPVAKFGGGATQFKPAPAEAQTGMDG